MSKLHVILITIINAVYYKTNLFVEYFDDNEQRAIVAGIYVNCQFTIYRSTTQYQINCVYTIFVNKEPS